MSPGLARPGALARTRRGGDARLGRRRCRPIELRGEGRRSGLSLAAEGLGQGGEGRVPVEVDHREAREARVLAKLGDGSSREQRVTPEIEEEMIVP